MRFLSKWKTICFLRMSYLSDTLTVGVLLVLLFGAISLYLYTRIQQAEQKIHLLESILLDLKMSTEIKSYTELPAEEEYSTPDASTDQERNQERNQERIQERNQEPVSEVQDKESDHHYVSLDDAVEPITEYTSLDDVEKNDTIITLDEAEKQNAEKTTTASTAATSVMYENMILKDLQSLARTRGITGASTMKKGAIIEALKTSDRTTVIKPGSSGIVGANSFLETSALVSDVSV